MKKTQKILWITLLSVSAIIFSGCVSNDKPEYIRRDFKNGKSIEVEIDDDYTTDDWECTGDCGGHNAGYEWAESKGIDDPSDCGGNSQSFIEGCMSYANEY